MDPERQGTGRMLIVLASLVGIFIGLNFKAVILVPLFLFGVAAYAALSIEHGFGATSLAIVVAAVSVQGGYMIGLAGICSHKYLPG